MAMDGVEYEIKGAESSAWAALGQAKGGIQRAPAQAKSCPRDGGDGLFFTTLSGTGTVWLQSLLSSRLATRNFAAAPQRGGRRQPSALGGLAVGGGQWAAFWGGDDE